MDYKIILHLPKFCCAHYVITTLLSVSNTK